MTKDNFFRLMRNDKPKWLGDPWDCFLGNPLTIDGVTMNLGGPNPGEMGVPNMWGVVFDFPADQPASVPHVTEDNCVVKDITCWQDYIQFPDIDKMFFPPVPENPEGKLVMCPSFLGPFEFSHYMMPFEEALMNYLLEPEAMSDMISAYMDWKIKAVERIIDELHPDVIHTHDDWGDKQRLFISPNTWREIIKPHYARFCAYIKSRGLLIQHHCDGVADVVAEDMVEMGIDMWQGVIPQNDIPGVLKKTEGKLCLLGGLDMGLIDGPDTQDADIRAHVRQVIDTYVPMGNFIPCATNINPLYPHVDKAVHEEMTEYGAAFAAAHF